jgi:two-component system, LytTR family, sensor kinase
MNRFLDWYLNFYPTSGTPIRRRIAIHVFYWLVFFIFGILSSFSESSLGTKMFISGFKILNGCTIFYGISYFAAPYLLNQKKIIWGIMILLFLFALNFYETYFFYILGIKYEIFRKSGSFYSYAQSVVDNGWQGIFYQENVFREIYLVLNAVLIPFMLKIARVAKAYSDKTSNLEKEKVDLEINFLRSQLNAKFLLDALQNINKKVDTNNDEAGDSIIVLSDYLKYVVYQSVDQLVELDREIKFIKNYIDLAKLNENEYLKINYSQTGSMKGHKIAPLILVNFIESAFNAFDPNENKNVSINFYVDFIENNLNLKFEIDGINDALRSKQEILDNPAINNAKVRLVKYYQNDYKLLVSENNTKSILELNINLLKTRENVGSITLKSNIDDSKNI